MRFSSNTCVAVEERVTCPLVPVVPVKVAVETSKFAPPPIFTDVGVLAFRPCASPLTLVSDWAITMIVKIPVALT